MGWRLEYDEKAQDLFYMTPGRKVYVDATYGSDGNAGTKNSPMKTGACGYAQLRTGRNDTLFAAQGNYILTGVLTWSKSDTNCIGLCENVEGDYGQGGVNIYTTTASVAHTIDITGSRCRFQNLKISNGGANAANLGAVLVEGQGGIFKNVAFMGILDAAQIASANPYSLGIAPGGYFPIFEDCVIGQSTWGPRTQTLSGHLKFNVTGAGTYGADGGIFRRCRFLSWAETASVSAVYIPIQGAKPPLDRMWFFDQCTFYNFWTSAATKITEVITDACTTTHHIVLKGCTAVGYDQWQTSDYAGAYITADMPITGLGGGLCRPPLNSVGT